MSTTQTNKSGISVLFICAITSTKHAYLDRSSKTIMCDLNCPEGILWTNQTCNPHLFVCTCMQSESPVPCMVHASRTHSAYFITLQTIEALVFVAILILLVILLYLHNQNKQKRLTVLNLQLLSLTGLQVGKYLFRLVQFISRILVNLCFLPGIYGAWELYAPRNPIGSVVWSVVVLSVQINAIFLIILLGYLFW